jgi:ParB family chromosome partitioning protein
VSNQRRLGRGLEALLGKTVPAPATAGGAAVASSPAPSGAARLFLHTPEEIEQAASTLPASEVPVGSIDPNPWQPRSVVADADIAELAESLREHGLVQPVVVRPMGDRYQLIAGQRRLAAARRLGWTKVLVRLLEVDDRQMSEIAIVENLQRRDLDALEKAASFRQYITTWQCTQDELAKRLSIDRSTVANLIRLLDLPDAVQKMLRSGGITMGHARALLPLGDEDAQVRLAERIASEGLSVRAIETEVHEILRGDEAGDDADIPATASTPVVAATAAGVKRKPGRPQTRRPAQITAVENDLRRALGVKVVVHANGRGAGRIVIPFDSTEEFQRLLDHITE